MSGKRSRSRSATRNQPPAPRIQPAAARSQASVPREAATVAEVGEEIAAAPKPPQDLRAMTQEAAQRRDEMLAEVARLEDDARVRASAIVASAQQKLEAERARLAEERAELRGRELALREREAQAQDDLAFAQVKESM